MKTLISQCIAVCLWVVLSVGAQAQAPAITQQQREHSARIEQGERSGTLTPKETRKLKREQRHIRKMKRVAKADGRITRGEKQIIKKEQRRAKRHIRHQKHDAQVRPQ